MIINYIKKRLKKEDVVINSYPLSFYYEEAITLKIKELRDKPLDEVIKYMEKLGKKECSIINILNR